jgi:hypothetical protein
MSHLCVNSATEGNSDGLQRYELNFQVISKIMKIVDYGYDFGQNQLASS